MGRIRLTGATSGYTELRAASTAGNNTITLPTTNGGEVVVSDSSGNVNIDSGTFYVDATNNRVGVGTSPAYAFHVSQSPNTTGIFLSASSSSTAGDYSQLAFGSTGSAVHAAIRSAYNNPQTGGATSLQFFTNNNSSTNEVARLDSSGRLLVGTSTARDKFNNAASGQDPLVQFEAAGTAAKELYMLSLTANNNSTSSNAGVSLMLARSNGTTLNSYDLVPSGNCIGQIRFQAADGSELVEAANISAFVDGTSGANDMPGRLVFSTTADGASSPTERMRITSDGDFLIEKTAIDATTQGFQYDSGGAGLNATVTITNTRTDGGAGPFRINRQGSDGTLIHLLQANTEEGSISVSGTTVSYNGAHLSRWSQIPGIDPHDKDHRPEILRGTVMSNLDEMCDWIDPESGEAQDNEQLNKTKISDVEGDKNVAGVFQSWDESDDTWVNDFYLAMTGDFIIRIGAGVTIERGDLLMSAGDGTAKPQDDDIIRSKTIAKVTSTNVSCTYDDGSYCVPCVLMAC